MNPIDTVKVSEQRERLNARIRRSAAGEKAAWALEWFGQYALDKGVVPAAARPNTINAKGELATAQSVLGSKEAQAYLTKATEAMRADIVTRAIELAQADFEASVKDE